MNSVKFAENKRPQFLNYEGTDSFQPVPQTYYYKTKCKVTIEQSGLKQFLLAFYIHNQGQMYQMLQNYAISALFLIVLKYDLQGY